MAKGKKRIDVLLLDLGLTESRERARALIMAGQVIVNGQRIDKPGMLAPEDATVEVKEHLPYVSRGGLKLIHGLQSFGLLDQVAGKVALDCGSSTGGFTDVMLQNGAERVYAVDVGTGQLAWKLRIDPRVVVMEGINARYLESLPELTDFAVTDVSFISLSLIVPVLKRLTKPEGWLVVLVKPQFEAGREQVGKGGVVRDPAVHRQVLERLAAEWAASGLTLLGLTRSPILGPAGNVEFLAYLVKQKPDEAPDSKLLINQALENPQAKDLQTGSEAV